MKERLRCCIHSRVLEARRNRKKTLGGNDRTSKGLGSRIPVCKSIDVQAV